jgi:thiaminase
MDKRAQIELLIKEANEQVEKVYSTFEAFPWNDKKAYADWLAQTYFYVSHTTRLLALAAARSSLEENKFHLKFIEHAAEEKGHERLCTADLKALSCNASDFSELPATSAIYHSLSYLIERGHPAAILGFAMVLEGLSAYKVKPVLDKLTQLYGRPASSFLRVHVDVDQGHNHETKDFLEHCNQHQIEVIRQGVQMIGHLYENMLFAVQGRNKVRKLLKAAA